MLVRGTIFAVALLGYMMSFQAEYLTTASSEVALVSPTFIMAISSFLMFSVLAKFLGKGMDRLQLSFLTAGGSVIVIHAFKASPVWGSVFAVMFIAIVAAVAKLQVHFATATAK